MKNTIFLIAISLFTFHLNAQNTNPKYDAELAKKVGADDYGMKSYIFVILKTGTNTSTDKAEVAKAFTGHMTNMDKMVEDGKLIVAGPIGDNAKNYRGIFILNETDMEKAKALLGTDPAIKAKFLDY